MKKSGILFVCLALGFGFAGCDEDPVDDTPVGPGESTTELLVKKFDAAPTLDGVIDGMWADVQKLKGTCEVPVLGPRMTFLNSNGAGVEEALGLFEPFSGDKYDFTLRSGQNGGNIYFLFEWDDADDSKDRQSWYFDPADKLWKQQHKYANDANDKYYEDKFAFFFPVGNVDNFNSSTCYAACHTVSSIAKDKDKHTRHYLKTPGQKIDMWHWKRVRSEFRGQIDDQKCVDVAGPYDSGSNGRTGDKPGGSGYSDNKVTLNNGTADVTVPKYIIPAQTNYYWIDEDQITAGTAKEVVGVDADGILTLDDASTIDPSTGGFEEAVGNMRVPSVTLKPFTGGRADINIKAVYTGSGWICEFMRKLDTGDADDAIFDPAQEMNFGMAIFNNAAIAHGIKPNLLMKFEQ